jgi:hypothetical protein
MASLPRVVTASNGAWTAPAGKAAMSVSRGEARFWPSCCSSWFTLSDADVMCPGDPAVAWLSRSTTCIWR